MTFGDFVRNYLNPIVLAMRTGLLLGGGGALLAAFGTDAPFVGRLLFGLLGLWLCWLGVKPWGKGGGMSLHQLNQAVRRINNGR